MLFLWSLRILSFVVTCLPGQQEAQLSAKSHPRAVSVRLLGLRALCKQVQSSYPFVPWWSSQKNLDRLCFRGRVSLRGPGIFGTHCAGHVGLYVLVAGIKGVHTTPGVKILNPLRGKSVYIPNQGNKTAPLNGLLLAIQLLMASAVLYALEYE